MVIVRFVLVLGDVTNNILSNYTQNKILDLKKNHLIMLNKFCKKLSLKLGKPAHCIRVIMIFSGGTVV